MSYNMPQPIKHHTQGIESALQKMSIQGQPHGASTSGVDADRYDKFMAKMHAVVNGTEPSRMTMAGADEDFEPEIQRELPAGVRRWEPDHAVLAGILPSGVRQTQAKPVTRTTPSGFGEAFSVPAAASKPVVSRSLPAGVRVYQPQRAATAGSDNVPRASTAGPVEECPMYQSALKEKMNGAHIDEASNTIRLPISGLELDQDSYHGKLFLRHLTSGCGQCDHCIARMS
jgi:hypothetical protein